MKNHGSVGLSDGNIIGSPENMLSTLLKPKCSLRLASFIIGWQKQLRQQAALAIILETFKIVECRSLKHWQDPTFVINFPGSDIISILPAILRLFGNPVSSARSYTGIGSYVPLACTVFNLVMVTAERRIRGNTGSRPGIPCSQRHIPHRLSSVLAT